VDVEKALLQGCGHVLARARDGEDAETELNHYLEMLRFQGDESGVSDPSKTRRLRNATLSYYVVGQSPERNVNRLGVQRARLRTRFLENISVVPGEDVKRALARGSTRVDIGVNYEASEEEKLELERAQRRPAELRRLRADLNQRISEASLPTAPRLFAVIGFRDDPKRLTPVGHALMPLTSAPGSDVEQDLQLGCSWITVTLLAGRPDLAQAIKDYEESADAVKKRENEDPFHSIPVPRPSSRMQRSVTDGPTICRVVGTRRSMPKQPPRVIWNAERTADPRQSVEAAIARGSTEVLVEVVSWGKSSRAPQ
jgi:hypothetical protein